MKLDVTIIFKSGSSMNLELKGFERQKLIELFEAKKTCKQFLELEISQKETMILDSEALAGMIAKESEEA